VIIAQKFDWFNLFIVINSNDKNKHEKELEGWDGDIDKGLWAKGLGSMENHVGFDGFRRMVWAMPMFWIILPLLYVPLVPTIGRMIYGWIAKNRYRFGCNSSTCKV
jgi:hypothetical protein